MESQYFTDDGFAAAYCECSSLICKMDDYLPSYRMFCYDSDGNISYQACVC